MLNHHVTEEANDTFSFEHTAILDPVMTDAPIESYLNRTFAPVIGTVSYDERQQMRSERRQEILSIVAAHMELGSSREEAIRLELRDVVQPVQDSTGQQSATARAHSPRVYSKLSSLAPATRAFAAAAAASLLLIAARSHAVESEANLLLCLVLGVFPFLAGRYLGVKNTRRPLAGMVLAQLLLYAPVTIAFYLVVSAQSHAAIDVPTALLTAAYTTISTLSGGVGILTSKWLRRKSARWPRRSRRT